MYLYNIYIIFLVTNLFISSSSHWASPNNVIFPLKSSTPFRDHWDNLHALKNGKSLHYPAWLCTQGPRDTRELTHRSWARQVPRRLWDLPQLAPKSAMSSISGQARADAPAQNLLSASEEPKQLFKADVPGNVLAPLALPWAVTENHSGDEQV